MFIKDNEATKMSKRQFHTGMHKPKTNTEQDEFRPCKTWRSEQKQPLFKIIDDYDPFDEPETSIAQSMKTKISTRFNEKMTHKEKCESIRRTTHSSCSKRRNLNIPLTNSKTIASLQAEFSDNITSTKNRLGGGFKTQVEVNAKQMSYNK